MRTGRKTGRSGPPVVRETKGDAGETKGDAGKLCKKFKRIDEAGEGEICRGRQDWMFPGWFIM